jgi:hypothetical protein
VKPFKCEKCSKPFAHKNHFNDHILKCYLVLKTESQ